MKKLLLPGLFFISAFLALPSPSQAGNIRLRLREHFDLSSIQLRGHSSESYFGLSSTVNVWYEEKGKYSIGLAFNPVIPGRDKALGSTLSLALRGIDPKIDIYNAGVEGKYYFSKEFGFFGRAGLFASLLDTDGLTGGNRKGFSYYVGLGWEIPLLDGKLGIAPEVAFRHGIFGKGYRVTQFSPSIGLHFYVREDVLKFGAS